jgi:hypothetical protein
MAKSPMDRDTPNQDGRNPLEETLGSFIGFCESFSRESIAIAPSGEHKELVSVTSARWLAQNKTLFEFIRENYKLLSEPQVQQIHIYLTVQDSTNLGKDGSAAAERGFKLGWAKKFLKWMLKFYKEIKKVLREIIELILDALGISFPKWLETIFLLLDELQDAIADLLSDVFGLDSREFSREISEAEQHYLAELTAMTKLKLARQGVKRESD